MNNSLHDIELIERYYDHDTSDSEKEILLTEIKKDKELKRLFLQEKLLVNAIRFHGVTNDLDYLKSVESTLTKRDTKSIPLVYYAIAASVTIFILIGVFVWLGKSSTDDLYAEYYTPYPNVFEPTLRGNEITNERTETFAAYEQGDYKKAVEGFLYILSDKKEPGVMLLLANAQLSLGKTNDAISLLKDLIASYDELDMQAKWYLALCYLKSNNSQEAKKLLQQLEGTEITYASKAKRLLQKMD